MSRQQNESENRHEAFKLIGRWFREVWGDGSEECIDELMHPEAIIHGIGTGPVVGPEGFKAFWRIAKQNYHDVQMDIDQLIVDQDEAVVHFTMRSIRTESGQTVTMGGAAFFRFQKGQFVFARNVLDYLAILGQTDALDVDISHALFPIQALDQEAQR